MACGNKISSRYKNSIGEVSIAIKDVRSSFLYRHNYSQIVAFI
jgi:hypothetical protein